MRRSATQRIAAACLFFGTSLSFVALAEEGSRRGTIWERVRWQGTGLFELRASLERLSEGGTKDGDILAFEKAWSKLLGGEPPRDAEVLGLLLHLGFEWGRVEKSTARREELFVLLGAVAGARTARPLRAWAHFHRASLVSAEPELLEAELTRTAELSLDPELTTRAAISFVLSRVARGAAVPEAALTERATVGGRGVLAARELTEAWRLVRDAAPFEEVAFRVRAARALLAARVNVSGREPFEDLILGEAARIGLRRLAVLELETTIASVGDRPELCLRLDLEGGEFSASNAELFGCVVPTQGESQRKGAKRRTP